MKYNISFFMFVAKIGRLPLGNFNGFPRIPYKSTEEYLSLPKIIRLYHFPTYKLNITARIFIYYGLPFYAAYLGAKSTYRFIPRAFDGFQHGEQQSQTISRYNVINSCNELKKITPEVLQITSLDTNHKQLLVTMESQCAEATKFFNTMEEVMKRRRTSGIGNQLYYGLRTKGGCSDKQHGERIVTADISDEIKQGMKQIIGSATKNKTPLTTLSIVAAKPSIPATKQDSNNSNTKPTKPGQ